VERGALVFLNRDELCVNSIRMLAVDMVEAANSGHPGLPLGAAPMAYVLWSRFLRFNAKNPSWPDRDRFVLSAGHGSAMLYALLHLFGFNYSVDDLKKFRQLGSKTPGHPEREVSLGVEVTTGPLGQGMSMAVGMAIAERFSAARYNKKPLNIVDHRTFALVSDGDLMEGVSAEAASFAGHQKLNKLICLYDANGISIEGSTSLAFTENVGKRFEAYGWKVLNVKDGNSLAEIERVLKKACGSKDKPVLIIVKTHIGFGSPKADSAEAHGSPLGKDAVQKTRKFFSWSSEPFFVPEKASLHFEKLALKGAKASSEWQEKFEL
jgi:transketolase